MISCAIVDTIRPDVGFAANDFDWVALGHIDAGVPAYPRTQVSARSRYGRVGPVCSFRARGAADPGRMSTTPATLRVHSHWGSHRISHRAVLWTTTHYLLILVLRTHIQGFFIAAVLVAPSHLRNRIVKVSDLVATPGTSSSSEEHRRGNEFKEHEPGVAHLRRETRFPLPVGTCDLFRERLVRRVDDKIHIESRGISEKIRTITRSAKRIDAYHVGSTRLSCSSRLRVHSASCMASAVPLLLHRAPRR